jgi:hypothetical protein
VPSQLPVFPQGPTPGAAGQVAGVVVRGALPAVIFEQVPTLLDNLQLWQPSVQALLQQTPSTQYVLVQSLPTVHCSPLVDLSPHLLVIVLHVMGTLQAELLPHVFRQVGLGELQTYGSHEDEVAAGHAPLPSQVAGRVWVPALQLSARQPVLLDQARQAPEPSHVPSSSQ